MNALQRCRWQFSHKKNFVADFLQAKCDFTRKTAVLRFWTPFGELKSNVRWSRWAHWKTRSGLLISINWAFFARCYGWGATSEYLFKIGNFDPTRPGWPKISGRMARPQPTIVILLAPEEQTLTNTGELAAYWLEKWPWHWFTAMMVIKPYKVSRCRCTGSHVRLHIGYVGSCERIFRLLHELFPKAATPVICPLSTWTCLCF